MLLGLQFQVALQADQKFRETHEWSELIVFVYEIRIYYLFKA